MIAPHVRSTIDDLHNLIGQMQSAVRVLEALEDQGAGSPAVGTSNHHTENLKREKPPAFTRNTVPARSGRGPSRMSRELAKHVVSVARTFSQPFTSEELRVKADLDNKKAYAFLARWNSKGWVRKLGRGNWELTKKFPAGSEPASVPVPALDAAAGRVHIPGLDKPPLKPLREQYEEALRERDRALGAGQATLGQIAQSKADRLAKQLGIDK